MRNIKKKIKILKKGDVGDVKKIDDL